MGWVKYSTVGAKAGTDLKDSAGNVLADTAVKNASIALGLSGTGLTLTNAGSGVTLSNNSVGLANVANVDMRDLDNATGGTLAIARGGTNAANSNGWLNTRVQTTNTGELKYDGTGAVAPNINTIPDSGTTKTYAGYAGTGLNSSGYVKTGIYSGGNVSVADMKDAKVRAFTGLTSLGIVDTTVPVGKGGTTQTNSNKFLNSDLGITLDGTDITLTKAGDTDSTDSVPSTLKNGTIAIDGTTGVISGIGTSDIKVNNSKVTQQADGTLNYAGATAAQVNIGSIAASNFDTAGDLTGDLSLKSALTIPAVAGNKIICGNITIDGQYGRIVITD